MNKLQKKCSAEIRRLAPQFGMTPQEINEGSCGLFSSMVVAKLGECAVVYESFTDGSSPGHCWITCCGRHFDAECPDGVEDPHDLPWFRRTGVRLETQATYHITDGDTATEVNFINQ